MAEKTRARLRRRPRPVRAVVRASRASTPPDVEPADAAPLRRGAVRAPRGVAGDRRAQARRAARRSTARCASTAHVSQNPADLRPVAQARRAACRRCCAPTRSARCSTAIPASTPLELRDRALFELAYALRPARRGAREARRRPRSTSTPRSCASRARARRPASSRSASRRCARVGRYLERGAPGRSRRGDGEQALFLSKSGRRLSTSDVRRRLRVWARHAAVQGGVSRTRCATRSRPTCSTAAPTCARSRSCSGHASISHDADLHSGRVRPPDGPRTRKSHPRA